MGGSLVLSAVSWDLAWRVGLRSHRTDRRLVVVVYADWCLQLRRYSISSTQKNWPSMRTLYVYRVDNAGVRNRWKMVLDDHMTVLEETKVNDSTTSTRNEAVKKDLTARGVEFEDRDGKVVITRIPEEEKRAIEVIVDPSKCWFPECHEIMKAYEAEKQKLPSDCPACQQGALIRKYRDLLINAAKKSG